MAAGAAVGLDELGRAEAAGDLLLNVARAQVALGKVFDQGGVRSFGEQPHGAVVLSQTLPDVMGISCRDCVPFVSGFGSRLPRVRTRRWRFCSTLNSRAVGRLCLRPEIRAAAELRKSLHVARSGVAGRLDDEGPLA